jgi:hypothetical protein
VAKNGRKLRTNRRDLRLGHAEAREFRNLSNVCVGEAVGHPRKVADHRLVVGDQRSATEPIQSRANKGRTGLDL